MKKLEEQVMASEKEKGIIDLYQKKKWTKEQSISLN